MKYPVPGGPDDRTWEKVKEGRGLALFHQHSTLSRDELGFS